MEPGGLKPPEGGTERRRQRAPRAPSMRYLVKLAVKCDSAEQLGRSCAGVTSASKQRQGLARPGNGRDEDAIAKELDRLLAHD
jgi:methylaspartate ammonia-lyase